MIELIHEYLLDGSHRLVLEEDGRRDVGEVALYQHPGPSSVLPWH